MVDRLLRLVLVQKLRSQEGNNELRQAPLCELLDRSQRPIKLMVSNTISVRFENILKKN